ncbi:uncharacterized protein LOC141909670 [Tubulanus polymorphus]|uniref:uncharacterized protein LOC141909670 n=1 Tax=Tubulanus polymorphus TaxID=672921 RepID=UPI003DA291A4
MLFEGESDQIVVVKVTRLFAGRWDENLGSCIGGRLLIYDGDKLYPNRYLPTTLCGRYNDVRKIMVKRVSSQNICKVVFHVDSAHSLVDFQMEVKFIKPDESNSFDIKLTYGNYFPGTGRVKGTLCDFVIDAADCETEYGCHLVSPGYPGIYPPSVRCKYLIKQSQGKRVEVKLGGYNYRGKFDLKPSPGCTEDFIQIFEGDTTDSPIISRVCGVAGEHFISQGDSLLLEFVSGPGGPNWNYNGFDAQILTRWKINYTGELVPGSICDYEFKPEHSLDGGDFHTPDHQIPEGTTCHYTFTSPPGMSVKFEIVVYEFEEDCSDSLQFVENDYVTRTICDHNIIQRHRNVFDYLSHDQNVTVVYRHKRGQISQHQPIFFDYQYVRGTRNLVTTDLIKYKPLPPAKQSELVPIRPKATLVTLAASDGGHSLACESVRPIGFVLIASLLVASFTWS